MEVTKRVWLRVTRQEPCAICQRVDWCTRTEGGACCMRVESAKPMKNGGFWHVTDAKEPVKRYSPPLRQKPLIAPSILLAHYKRDTTPAMLIKHAGQLGVDPMALDVLGVAWCQDKQAWCWPERDGYNKLVGGEYRTPKGDKFFITGATRGLAIPQITFASKRLFVTEGARDAAAGLTLGLWTVSRGSCTGGTDHLRTYIARTKPREVVIVADNDAPHTRPNGETYYPGQAGAHRLSEALLVTNCVWVTPLKDLRQSCAAGLDADDIAQAVRDLVWSRGLR